MKSKLSVIMPVYNREQFVVEAILSIILQTYADFELLVIDDCSTDKTLENVLSIDDKRIKVLKLSSHMNVPEIRNYGIKHSKGNYIAWMDSDDIALPSRLQKQIDYLDSHPDVDILSCHYQLFGGSTQQYFLPENNLEIKYTLMFNSCFANPALMFRRNYLERTGLAYDTKFYLCEDYKFYVDAIQTAVFANIPEILLRYRVGHSNITGNSFNDSEQLVQRKQLLDEIHHVAIENNRFNLSTSELQIFNLFFGDANKHFLRPTHDEYTMLLDIFDTLEDQAKHNSTDMACLRSVLNVAKHKINSKFCF